MRMLLKFAEWVRKASCLLIHLGWKKTEQEGGSSPSWVQQGCLLLGVCSTSVGLPLPISHIVNKPLASVAPKTKGVLRLEWWNQHLHGDGDSTKPASPLQSPGQCGPPPILHLVAQVRHVGVALDILLLSQSPRLVDFTSTYTLSTSTGKVHMTFTCHWLWCSPCAASFTVLPFVLQTARQRSLSFLLESTLWRRNNVTYKEMYSFKVEFWPLYIPV